MACELKTRFDVFWKICKSPFARNPFCYKNSRYALQGTNGLGKHKINFIPIVWKVALFDISISDIDCRYIDTLKNIDIDIDKDILENIDIVIDIDKEILENIDIDKISNQLEFGISNRATWG